MRRGNTNRGSERNVRCDAVRVLQGKAADAFWQARRAPASIPGQTEAGRGAHVEAARRLGEGRLGRRRHRQYNNREDEQDLRRTKTAPSGVGLRCPDG